MTKTMRETTLQTLGLGTVSAMFQNGRPPVTAGDLVDQVFGNSGQRGSMVISGLPSPTPTWAMPNKRCVHSNLFLPSCESNRER